MLSANDSLRLTAFGRKINKPVSENIRFIKGDYSDSAILEEALKGQDIVYHFISQSYPFSTWNDPASELDKNILPFINFIELCNTSGVKKIVFASSGGTIYGINPSASHELSVTKPYTPHGISKLHMENLLMYAKVKYNIAYDIYRISNVYGDDQVTQKGLGFIHAALESAIKGKPVAVFGDGSNTRDYIYIDDVCNFLTLSLRKPLGESDTYNICSSLSVSLNDILQIMRNDLNIDFSVEFQSGRKSDVPAVCLVNKKILELFPGYRFVSLKEGVEKIYHSLSKIIVI